MTFFGSDILPEEVTPDLLDGVAAVHLDSRHTPAAVALAKLANQRSVRTLPEEILVFFLLAVGVHPIYARRSLVAHCCCARLGATACDELNRPNKTDRVKRVLSHIGRLRLVFFLRGHNDSVKRRMLPPIVGALIRLLLNELGQGHKPMLPTFHPRGLCKSFRPLHWRN